MMKSKILSNLLAEIKYFIQPKRFKDVVIDPASYVRIEYAFIDKKPYPFFSGDLYVSNKRRFSSKKTNFKRIWYKAWIGVIPINGVDTKITLNINDDVLSGVRRNYPNWVAGPEEGPLRLNYVKV